LRSRIARSVNEEGRIARLRASMLRRRRCSVIGTITVAPSINRRPSVNSRRSHCMTGCKAQKTPTLSVHDDQAARVYARPDAE